MIQPDPAIVRAILAKHDDNDRPSACETCVLADELANNEAILAAHAGETMRIRVEIRDLLSALESGGLVRADRVAARLAQILEGGMRNEVCDNCGLPVVAVRLPGGRFCSSECAEAFELS